MRRQPLFRKYVAVFIILVSGALIASGVVQLYFSYQENQTALLSLQHEKAAGAATRIEQFLQEIEHQLDGLILVAPTGTQVSVEQRRADYLRLLREAPAITDISYLDASGAEQLRISRLAMNVVGGGTNYSNAEKFLQALAKPGRTYFSAVYFRGESEPYMTVSIAEASTLTGGVNVAEVNLKFIWDVVSQIQVGQAGYAYVVDASGRLVAHPDISLVLQQTDLSALPQVKGVRTGGEQATIAVDSSGHRVLTARQAVDPPGWSVFVEQPLEEAFAPLYASLLRTVLLVLAGLALSVVASLVLARRMVWPIVALQGGAARIGSGALDQRIDVRTGDELEDLGESFNHMASRLQESYASLEQKVADRTRDLAQALDQVRALGEVSQVVNSSLDLQRVLTTIVTHAVELSGTDGGALYEFDEPTQHFNLRATHGMSSELLVTICEGHVRLGETIVGAATQLAVPLQREEQIIGALVVRKTAPGPFPDETVDLVQRFATQSVLAIHNARLFQEIERKSRQLEVASRHKSEFLANMSHELRTPLNAIIGFSEVLTERLFGELNDKQAEYLEDILGSGRHLLSLINDILDLSKVEAGRMELEPAIFSLTEALDNGLTMVRERASRHGLTLSLDVDDSISLIEADERKVKQVIFNLLSNAVKFTPDRGRVDVAARLIDSRVHVSVRDTGIGIAAEDQARIFDEFQQVPSGIASDREGTGLGLALARRFVELHGGLLWVDSQVGVGSTFTFTLPMPLYPVRTILAYAEPDGRQAYPDERPQNKVLVVEDNLQPVDLAEAVPGG